MQILFFKFKLFLFRADPKVFNSNGQNAVEIATFFNHGAAVKVFNDFLKPSKTPGLELVNFFSHSAVDRQSYKRTDQDNIQNIMRSSKSKFVVFGELQLLVTTESAPKTGCQVLYLTWSEIENFLKDLPKSEREIIFLGVGDIEKGVLMRETVGPVDDDIAYFAINFKKVSFDYLKK